MKTCICVYVYFLTLVLLPSQILAQVDAKEVLHDLYVRELLAQATYGVFSQKADSEGYKSLAILFRAASQSASVHLEATINIMQGNRFPLPKVDLSPLPAKSTPENLKTMISFEQESVTKLYPAFEKILETSGQGKALRLLRAVIKARTQGLSYYAQAQGDLNAWRDGQKKFIVCSRCGYLTNELGISKCPVCALPRDEFMAIK